MATNENSGNENFGNENSGWRATFFSFGMMNEAEEALRSNVTAAAEGTQAFISGLHVVTGELGRFTKERVANQGALASKLLTNWDPTEVVAELAEFWVKEARAWEEEQSRLVRLWSQALTDSLVTFEDIAQFPMPEPIESLSSLSNLGSEFGRNRQDQPSPKPRKSRRREA